jgi:hypothetical protein
LGTLLGTPRDAPRKGNTRLAQYRHHVEELLAPYRHAIHVVWCKRIDRARVMRDVDGSVIEVQIPPIRSSIAYATALHEIGHIFGRHQNSRRMLVREREAWRWARAIALIWTPAMERVATKSLAWYARKAR